MYVIVILISKSLKCYSKAKRTRAPAYSRALRRIKGGFQRGSREAHVRFPEYQEVYPRAAELAAGRRPEKKCGLAAGKIAASRQPAGKEMRLSRRKNCG